MAGDNLLQYVRTQSDNRVDPKIVRYTLIKSGWPPDKVDRAILKIYPKRDTQAIHGNKHLLRWLIVVIAVLMMAMIITYVQLINEIPAPYDPQPQPTPPTTQESTCADITESVAKDDCYFKQISEGYDCDVLVDKIERNFCFRALDSYIMSY